jgi:hypothetical protein
MVAVSSILVLAQGFLHGCCAMDAFVFALHNTYFALHEHAAKDLK